MRQKHIVRNTKSKVSKKNFTKKKVFDIIFLENIVKKY